MKTKTATVVLDVREDLQRGRSPLGKIVDAAEALLSGQSLTLISPFEPLPLFAVLGKMGFTHRAEEIAPGHWETFFSRGNVIKTQPIESSVVPEQKDRMRTIDARGLEPPQPLVKILGEVQELSRGESVRAHTDRKPMHLLDALPERGLTATTEEQPDGSWITFIQRK